MKDRREINIEVFEDTMKHYKSNPALKAAVSNSVANQKFTAADETVELPQDLLDRVQADTGCEIDGYQISFSGTCQNCVQKH